jgi:hypothetical protein
MKNKKSLFLEKWRQAQIFIDEQEIEKADESLDWCLLLLAKSTLRGESKFEGKKIDTWKTKVWSAVESIGLLPE